MDWQEISAQIDEEFRCTHPVQRLCVRLTSNDRKQFVRQCQRCGHKTSALRYADLTQAEMNGASAVNDPLEADWRQRRWARSNELRTEAIQNEKDEWRARYDAYLRTPKWKSKSARVIARDKICQACLCRPAVQAHHKDYRHVGDEPLFDLVGVCLECHRKLHDSDAIAYGLRNNFTQAGVSVSA